MLQPLKEPDPYHTELMDIRRTGDCMEAYQEEDHEQEQRAQEHLQRPETNKNH